MQSLNDLSAASAVLGSSILTCLPPQDVIKKTVETKMKMEKERKQKEQKATVFSSQRSALDRFKK